MFNDPKDTPAKPRRIGKKRNFIINGRHTSLTIEDEFWDALRDLARLRGWSAQKLLAHIEDNAKTDNLCSAIRVFVLAQYRPPKAGEKLGG